MTARGVRVAGGTRNGLPAGKPYRWRGKPVPVPEPVERPKTSWTPGSRAERLETLTRMRISHAHGVNYGHLPHGVLTIEEAARALHVSKRTITRDLHYLRASSNPGAA